MLTKEDIAGKSSKELSSLVISLQKQVQDQSNTIFILTEKLRLSQHRQFGKKSERHTEEDHPQALLFDEAELPNDETDIIAADEKITVAAYQREVKGNKIGRKPLPAELPRKERLYDLTENEKTCSCGGQMHCIGDERSEQLGMIPAKMFVIVHVRKKYACKECETAIKQAKLTP